MCLAGGVESMSRAPFAMLKSTQAFDRCNQLVDTTLGWRFVHPDLDARFGTDSMPETGENVAEQFGVSREDQDAFAFRSQSRAKMGIERGFFKGEIIPVTIPRGRGSDCCRSGRASAPGHDSGGPGQAEAFRKAGWYHYCGECFGNQRRSLCLARRR